MNARELALSVVRDVFPAPDSHAIERGAQAAFDYRARRSQLDERDRAFAAELAYGAIKMRRALDWQLQPFLSARVPPAIHEILRLAAYELIFTRADVHATVFEFVNLAKKFGHRGLGNLVNAVLRSMLRAGPATARPESFESEDEYLATRFSLPTWLVRQWREVFEAQLEHVCAAVNAPPRSAIVVNALASSREEIAERLRLDGIETAPSSVVEEALLIERGPVTRAHGDGRWWPQSESSAMAVDVLGPQPEEAILDVCSGRGNKALQIGARLRGRGELCCIERDERKVEVLARRLEEAEMVAALVTGDASAEILPAERRFDRVLLDAPCSGIGVVGRHPEARWKKHGTDGERLALTQRALLERAARHVYPGGALVYAVCSTDPRETNEVIDWFLARQNFERGLIPAQYASFMTSGGDVLVPPGLEGRDGFYIARIERRP
ncbi:MAG TPA: transcription antitermination factor NusB [Candidatus Cybelea sp.]|jgi:16S rRNA (cytosine967-C5)-methyltransferase|nr:transcription antitermination factor NusB [Candidatus Cybelea sp.]